MRRYRPLPVHIRSNIPLLTLCAVGATLTLGGGPMVPRALAQQAGASASAEGVYDGRPIREVVIETEDGGELEATVLRLAENQIRSRRGEPFRAGGVTEDIQRLGRTGRFGRVTSQVELLADGSVSLTYVVVLQPIVQDVQVVGNSSINDGEIAAVVGLLVGTPVDRFQLDRNARRIERLYREKGFYQVEVSWDEDELLETGIVLFRIQEAQRIKVTAIRFDGADSYEHKFLRAEIETRKVGLLNRGRLDYEVLDQDVAALVRFYLDRGHLDVRVGRTILESPNGKEAIVTFIVDEGPVYTLRDVRLFYPDPNANGGGELTAEQAAGLMSIRSGDAFAVSKLRESIAAVRSAYGKLGYVDIALQPVEYRDPDLPVVDLELIVRQGARAFAGEVIVQGNTITRHDIVRNETDIRPLRPLDLSLVNETRRDLNRTRLFDAVSDPPRVTIQPGGEPTSDGSLIRDVLIEVAETNTGNFGLGVQFDSDNGVVASLNVEQRNFDLFDTPGSLGELASLNGFRGGGQTLNLTLLPGSVSQDYSISLTEPSLNGTNYSSSGSLYYRTREFSEHERQTIGGRLSLGRRFGTLWTGSVVARLETVELSNIDSDAPVDYFEFEDRSLLDGIGFNLTRSTYDDRFRPTRGAQVTLGVEQVGVLGGDFDITRLEASHKVFLKIDEDFLGRPSRLSLETRVGYIPQDQGDVPIYERFFQGGRGFRGFDFRTISPKGVRADTGTIGDDPAGGTFSFFWGAQVEQPILGDNLAVVAFLDTGTVADSVSFSDYRVSVGTGLRLSVPQLSPVPLAFDFGFPLLKAEGDKNRLFTFTVDLPF